MNHGRKLRGKERNIIIGTGGTKNRTSKKQKRENKKEKEHVKVFYFSMQILLTLAQKNL